MWEPCECSLMQLQLELQKGQLVARANEIRASCQAEADTASCCCKGCAARDWVFAWGTAD